MVRTLVSEKGSETYISIEYWIRGSRGMLMLGVVDVCMVCGVWEGNGEEGEQGIRNSIGPLGPPSSLANMELLLPVTGLLQDSLPISRIEAAGNVGLSQSLFSFLGRHAFDLKLLMVVVLYQINSKYLQLDGHGLFVPCSGKSWLSTRMKPTYIVVHPTIAGAWPRVRSALHTQR